MINKRICLAGIIAAASLSSMACGNEQETTKVPTSEYVDTATMSETEAETVSEAETQEPEEDFDRYEKPASSDLPETENMHVVKTWNGEESISVYSGDMSVSVNDNFPYLKSEETTTTQFFKFSGLDELGRSKSAMACICQETLPHSQRENIQLPEPSGWTYDGKENAKKYKKNGTEQSTLVACHLIGYECIGDDSMPENFFTATPSAQDTIAIYERQVVNYVQNTGNHVMYRATPVFYGDNLMADGVQLEAYSVEDNGKGISFNTFVYNVEPGIVYDYATGQNQQTS